LTRQVDPHRGARQDNRVSTRKTHVTLGIGLVLLIGLAALLLILLQQRSQSPEEDQGPSGSRPAAPPTSTRVTRRSSPARPAPGVASPAPPPAAEPKVAQTVDAGSPRRVEPPPRTGPSAREPLGVHTAPAAIPASIANETDPVKRAQLMQMHELAVARTRASRLRRRLRMLKATLARGRSSKNWSADEIRRTEKDIADLERGVTAAEQNVKRAERAVNEQQR
jgi:hypothetical protein